MTVGGYCFIENTFFFSCFTYANFTRKNKSLGICSAKNVKKTPLFEQKIRKVIKKTGKMLLKFAEKSLFSDFSRPNNKSPVLFLTVDSDFLGPENTKNPGVWSARYPKSTKKCKTCYLINVLFDGRGRKKNKRGDETPKKG
jgi:hypothetical protein